MVAPPPPLTGPIMLPPPLSLWCGWWVVHVRNRNTPLIALWYDGYPPPPPLPALLCFLPRSLCGVGGGLFMCVTVTPPSPCGAVVGFGLFNPRPPPLSSPPGGGLWVSGLVLNPFPPPCGVVVCVGFRA